MSKDGDNTGAPGPLLSWGSWEIGDTWVEAHCPVALTHQGFTNGSTREQLQLWGHKGQPEWARYFLLRTFISSVWSLQMDKRGWGRRSEANSSSVTALRWAPRLLSEGSSLTLAQWVPFWTSDLQNYERINLCCFKWQSQCQCHLSL